MAYFLEKRKEALEDLPNRDPTPIIPDTTGKGFLEVATWKTIFPPLEFFYIGAEATYSACATEFRKYLVAQHKLQRKKLGKGRAKRLGEVSPFAAVLPLPDRSEEDKISDYTLYSELMQRVVDDPDKTLDELAEVWDRVDKQELVLAVLLRFSDYFMTKLISAVLSWNMFGLILPTQPRIVASQFHKWLHHLRDKVKKIDVQKQIKISGAGVDKLTKQNVNAALQEVKLAQNEWDDLPDLRQVHQWFDGWLGSRGVAYGEEAFFRVAGPGFVNYLTKIVIGGGKLLFNPTKTAAGRWTRQVVVGSWTVCVQSTTAAIFSGVLSSKLPGFVASNWFFHFAVDEAGILLGPAMMTFAQKILWSKWNNQPIGPIRAVVPPALLKKPGKNMGDYMTWLREAWWAKTLDLRYASKVTDDYDRAALDRVLQYLKRRRKGDSAPDLSQAKEKVLALPKSRRQLLEASGADSDSSSEEEGEDALWDDGPLEAEPSEELDEEVALVRGQKPKAQIEAARVEEPILADGDGDLGGALPDGLNRADVARLVNDTAAD